MTREQAEQLLKNLAYINQKCMQASRAGVFDEVEIKHLRDALEEIHVELRKAYLLDDGLDDAVIGGVER